MFDIKPSDSPYSTEIVRFFQREFPKAAVKTSGELLDCIMEALFSTGQVRYGPRPRIEMEMKMRAIVAPYVEAGKPIPILIPWGARKPSDNEGVDVAEVASAKTLLNLQERVEAVYSPGTDMVIRLEDVSGLNLSRDNMEQAKKNMDIYSPALATLFAILGVTDFLGFHRESYNMGVDSFVAYSKEIEPHMERYIIETDLYGLHNYRDREAYKVLQSLGWQGEVPMETRSYYRDSHLFEQYTCDEERTKALARYLSGSLVRSKMNLRGNRPSWEHGWLTLSFSKPVPGNPMNVYLFYRTAPENVTRTHIPPWRAKGYLIQREDGAKFKLASHLDNLPYYKDSVTLTRGQQSVSVQTDYIIEGGEDNGAFAIA